MKVSVDNGIIIPIRAVAAKYTPGTIPFAQCLQHILSFGLYRNDTAGGVIKPKLIIHEAAANHLTDCFRIRQFCFVGWLISIYRLKDRMLSVSKFTSDATKNTASPSVMPHSISADFPVSFVAEMSTKT